MKILLLTNDIKWNSLPKRMSKLEKYFKERLSFMYSDVTIDIKEFKTDIYPDHTGHIQASWIQNRMIKPNDEYDAVGIVIKPQQWKKAKGLKNLLGGYIRDNDMKFGFYIICTEHQTRKIKGKKYKVLENTFEHELCGHGVQHDLGLKWESNKTRKFKQGYDNTHYFFYNNKIEEYYEYLEAEAKNVLDNLNSKVQEFKDKLSQMKLGETETISKEKFMPLVERKAKILIECAKIALGYDLRITSSLRSFEEQNALYAKGRTELGRVVTNARGGQSLHNYGVAFDLVDRTRGYDIDWDRVSDLWDVITNHEGIWGGDWKFVDKPHFQLTFDYKLSDFQSGKIDWKKFE